MANLNVSANVSDKGWIASVLYLAIQKHILDNFRNN